MFIDAGKKFGITDFVNPTSCGEKSVSQVDVQYSTKRVSLLLVIRYNLK